MFVIDVNECDLINYKKPAMFIVCPFCTFKCDKDNGCKVCQNSALAQEKVKHVDSFSLCERYIHNPLTSAVVFGGLEPLELDQDVLNFIEILRDDLHCNDDVVIYTGYTQDEVTCGFRDGKTDVEAYRRQWWDKIQTYPNIIMKFGRFLKDRPSRFDPILGITLASDNQYAEVISKC